MSRLQSEWKRQWKAKEDARRARELAAAVLEGIGIGFFLEQNVRDDLEAGLMQRVLADWTLPMGDLCLYYPGRRHHSAALKAFIALAREVSKTAVGSPRFPTSSP